MANLAQHEFFGLLDCNPGPFKLVAHSDGDGWVARRSADILLVCSTTATHRVVNGKGCRTNLTRCLRVARFYGGLMEQPGRTEAMEKRAEKAMAKYTRWLKKWESMQEGPCGP